MSRRSRSRERHRSRSPERFRRRWSRSPIQRRSSPRRRSGSKSPDRRRKRSPFINEITRHFGDEALKANTAGYILQPTPRSLLPPPLMSGVPQQHYMPHPDSMGPPTMQGPPGFNHYESHPPPGPSMNFEPMPMHPVSQPDYSTGPVGYNQPNLIIHGQVRPSFIPMPTASPQPVPAPTIDPNVMFGQPAVMRVQATTSARSDSGSRSYDRGSSAGYNGASHRDRLKTPEPPVISVSKVIYFKCFPLLYHGRQ